MGGQSGLHNKFKTATAIYTVTLCRNLVLAWGRVQLRGKAIEGLANWAQWDRVVVVGGLKVTKGQHKTDSILEVSLA